jgi:hypothetical protein
LRDPHVHHARLEVPILFRSVRVTKACELFLCAIRARKNTMGGQSSDRSRDVRVYKQPEPLGTHAQYVMSSGPRHWVHSSPIAHPVVWQSPPSVEASPVAPPVPLAPPLPVPVVVVAPLVVAPAPPVVADVAPPVESSDEQESVASPQAMTPIEKSHAEIFIFLLLRRAAELLSSATRKNRERHGVQWRTRRDVPDVRRLSIDF